MTSSFEMLPEPGEFPGLNARLRQVSVAFDWKREGLSATGQFFYLAFRAGKPTQEEFTQTIYRHIVQFAVPRTTYNEALATKDPARAVDLYEAARGAFVRAEKSTSTSGEAGELILFLLLEEFYKAPQISCKLDLKTSSNVPVHGADAVHARFCETSDRLLVYWGESKLRSRLDRAVTDTAESLEAFLKSKPGGAPRAQEIQVLQRHLNVSTDEQREALLKFFNPYCEESNARIENFACLIGFDYNYQAKLADLPAEEAEAEFRSRYEQRVNTACKLIAEKIKGSAVPVDRFQFVIFLLPFESVEELRLSFVRRLEGK